MAKKRRHKKPGEIYTLLSIRVDSYQVCADASVNYQVHQPQYAGEIDDEDPLFQYVTNLTIIGTSIYPEERANARYEVTIYGDDAPSRGVYAKLKDAQVRGEYGSPQYREYRGRQIPVYRPPSGFGLIEKLRGELAWTSWLNVAPRLATDMLILLGQQRQVYLGIDERKAGRSRWVRSISLQTTDPAID